MQAEGQGLRVPRGGGGDPLPGVFRSTPQSWLICLQGLMHRSPRPSFSAGSGYQTRCFSRSLEPSQTRQPTQTAEPGGFLAAAFDCSTKSRAREIPRHFEDGRPAAKPLRSEALPEGLAGPSKRDQERVDQDNKACAFALQAIQAAAERGAGALRRIGFCPRRSNPSSRGCGRTPTMTHAAGGGTV